MGSSQPVSISLHLHNVLHPKGLQGALRNLSAFWCTPLSRSSCSSLSPHCLLPDKPVDTFITSKCVHPGAFLTKPVGLLAAGGHS